ncbi:hypothetical protein Trydic_g13890 [Trypoxylus dichotomus]
MEQNLSSLNITRENYERLNSLGFINVNEIKDTETVKQWPELTFVPTTKTALDVYCENSESGRLYTFNKELDELLEDELIPGNIIEICGEPGTGKTQVCFLLSINVQLPKWVGGKEGGALYLCTNYNFSTERLKELSRNMLRSLAAMQISKERRSSLNSFSIDTILKNIHHIQINTFDEFIATVVYLQKWLKCNKVCLLVIDCITPIIQQLDYTEKRHFIYNFFGKIQKLATEYGFVVIITNNITLRAKSIDNAYKTPALGEAYFHRINSRILLERPSGRYFKATMEKSKAVDNIIHKSSPLCIPSRFRNDTYQVNMLPLVRSDSSL